MNEKIGRKKMEEEKKAHMCEKRKKKLKEKIINTKMKKK